MTDLLLFVVAKVEKVKSFLQFVVALLLFVAVCGCVVAACGWCCGCLWLCVAVCGK